MKSIIERLIIDEEGQGLIEYGLILAIVVVMSIMVLTSIGHFPRTVISEVNHKLH